MANNYDMAQVNLPKTIAFCLGATFCLSVMMLFVKLAAPTTTNSMTIFFRFLVSFIYILMILGYERFRGNNISLKVDRWWLHILRAIFGMISMLCLYYSLRFIPLMDGSLLSMTNPLFIPIIALLLFGIKTKLKVVLAIIAGFAGVVLVLRPGFSMVDPHAIYALFSGICVAIVIILLRQLAKRDAPQVIMFYYFLTTVIAGGVIALFNWHTPNLHTVLLLLGVGIFGSIYQDCLIRASQHAPAPVLAVFLYTSVIFSGLLDWLVWGIMPDLYTIIGLIIICIASYVVVKS